MQYAEPGFLPTRDHRGLEGLAPAVRKAIEWGEYISQQRLSGEFSLDGFMDPIAFKHHNDVILNYWVHTGLLQRNTRGVCSSYEWPPHSKNYIYKSHPHEYIGNYEVLGILRVFYNETNFPGMLVKVSTLLEQAESPTLHYVLGGTRTNEYPTAFNHQIQGAGRASARRLHH